MAVAYNLPDQYDDRNAGANGDSNNNSYNHSPNMTTSSTQTPLHSPVSGEYLVQAFCEAIYRCQMNGSPAFNLPPPSPSCSVSSPVGSYGGEVFFPRGRSTPRSPRSNDDGVFFRAPRSHRNSVDYSRRSRLTSTGDNDDECQSEHETSLDELDDRCDRYEHYMAARERLQEFSGRIPPRKKKKDTTKPKPKEDSFSWPTVVTVFVFAVGCGFLVTR